MAGVLQQVKLLRQSAPLEDVWRKLQGFGEALLVKDAVNDAKIVFSCIAGDSDAPASARAGGLWSLGLVDMVEGAYKEATGRLEEARAVWELRKKEEPAGYVRAQAAIQRCTLLSSPSLVADEAPRELYKAAKAQGDDLAIALAAANMALVAMRFSCIRQMAEYCKETFAAASRALPSLCAQELLLGILVLYRDSLCHAEAMLRAVRDVSNALMPHVRRSSRTAAVLECHRALAQTEMADKYTKSFVEDMEHWDEVERRILGQLVKHREHRDEDIGEEEAEEIARNHRLFDLRDVTLPEVEVEYVEEGEEVEGGDREDGEVAGWNSAAWADATARQPLLWKVAKAMRELRRTTPPGPALYDILLAVSTPLAGFGLVDLSTSLAREAQQVSSEIYGRESAAYARASLVIAMQADEPSEALEALASLQKYMPAKSLWVAKAQVLCFIPHDPVANLLVETAFATLLQLEWAPGDLVLVAGSMTAMEMPEVLTAPMVTKQVDDLGASLVTLHDRLLTSAMGASDEEQVAFSAVGLDRQKVIPGIRRMPVERCTEIHVCPVDHRSWLAIGKMLRCLGACANERGSTEDALLLHSKELAVFSAIRGAEACCEGIMATLPGLPTDVRCNVLVARAVVSVAACQTALYGEDSGLGSYRGAVRAWLHSPSPLLSDCRVLHDACCGVIRATEDEGERLECERLCKDIEKRQIDSAVACYGKGTVMYIRTVAGQLQRARRRGDCEDSLLYANEVMAFVRQESGELEEFWVALTLTALMELRVEENNCAALPPLYTEMEERLKSFEEVSSVYDNIINLFGADDVEYALVASERQIAYLRRHDCDAEGLACALVTQGVMLLQIGETERSISVLEEALTSGQLPGDAACQGMLVLASSLMAANRLEEAKVKAEEVIELASGLGEEDLQGEATELLREVYEKMGASRAVGDHYAPGAA